MAECWDCPGFGILRPYAVLLRSLRVRGWSLAEALGIAAGAIDPQHGRGAGNSDSPETWTRLVLWDTWKIAAKFADLLLDPDRRTPYWAALAVRTDADLLACLAATLYLHQGDLLLGKHWEQLGASRSPRHRQPLESARRTTLAILRGFLARDLGEGLAWAPAGADRSIVPPDRRDLVALHSHVVRATLILTLLGREQPPGFLARLRDCAGGKFPIGDILTEVTEHPCLPLVLGPLYALVADLKHAAARANWRRPAGERPSTRQGPHWSQATIADIADESAVTDWDDETRYDDVDSTAEDTNEEPLPDPKDLPGPASPGAAWLVPAMRDSVRRYEPVLLAVLRNCEETSPDMIATIHCGGISVPKRWFFRLRFGAQLWSYFSEQRLSVAQRGRLADALGLIFDDRDDEHTGTALAAFRSCTGKERWGASHDRVLGEIVDRVLSGGDATTGVADPGDPARLEIISLLSRLGQLDPCLELPTVDLADIAGQWNLFCTLRTLSAGRLPVGTATQLEVIKRAILGLMLRDPQRLLTFLRQTLAALPLPEIVIGAFSQDAFTAAARAIRDALRHASEVPMAATAAQTPAVPRVPGRCLAAGLDLLAERLRLQPPQPPDDDEAKIERSRVIGFFSQMYAPSQEPGRRTWRPAEWEFLAYRIVHAGGPPVYREVYRRIAERYPVPGTSERVRLWNRLASCGDLLSELTAAAGNCAKHCREDPS